MSFNPTEEGDKLDAASIEDRFAEVTAEMNDLKVDQFARRRLGHNHTPSLLDPYSLFDLFTGGSDDALVADEHYDNTIPVAGGGIQLYLELFAPSGPYGPYTRPVAPAVGEDGWLIPRSATAPEGMNVVLSTPTDLVTHNLLGLKVNAWIDIREMLEAPNLADPTTNPAVSFGSAALYLGIGIRDSAGTRHVIERSIRRVSAPLGRFGPLAAMTVITPADLSAGTLNGTLAEVFGAVISGVWDAAVNQHASSEPAIRQFAVTVEPLRGGDLD